MRRGEASTISYESALLELSKILARGYPLTARQISVELGVSRQTAYKRLRSLVDRGELRTARAREGATGPMSVVYVAKK